jgi:hypothetical protein
MGLKNAFGFRLAKDLLQPLRFIGRSSIFAGSRLAAARRSQFVYEKAASVARVLGVRWSRLVLGGARNRNQRGVQHDPPKG